MLGTFERTEPDEKFLRPLDWGNDSLSKYLQNSFESVYYTFNTQRPQVRRVSTLLDMFGMGDAQLSDVRRKYPAKLERFKAFDSARPFLSACRAQILAAASLTCSHLPFAAPKPLRGAIETALYGFHIFGDPDARARWEKRPTADAVQNLPKEHPLRKERRAIGHEFSATKILRAVEKTDSKLAKTTLDAYEELIDWGGHHNIDVENAAVKRSTTGRHHVESYTIIGSSNRALVTMLKEVNFVGALALRIFDLMYREHWHGTGFSGKVGAFTRKSS